MAKLVYKPHEYYTYNYHKRYSETEFIGTNLAI